MGGGARPGVVLWFFDEACPDRIQLYIADRIQEVLGVERQEIVAPLPEVAANCPHPMDPLGVLAVHGAQRSMHGRR